MYKQKGRYTRHFYADTLLTSLHWLQTMIAFKVEQHMDVSSTSGITGAMIRLTFNRLLHSAISKDPWLSKDELNPADKIKIKSNKGEK